jgi:hypothetical protein
LNVRIPFVSVSYARNGSSTKADALGMRVMQEPNDEVLERIYIGRRFRNDTERLEKLFDLYTQMNASAAAKPARRAKA